MRNINEIVTDEDITRVWQYANFGAVSKRDVILEALKDFAQGFSTGNTAKCIVSELGLTRINNGTISLSEAGLEYLISAYQSTPTHGRTAEEIAKIALEKHCTPYGKPDPCTHAFISGYNQAMHDFRNQPQQVREEYASQSKGQAGESVDEKIFKEASDYAERVCNGEFPIEYTKEQVVKHTKNDFIAGAKCVISTFQKDNEDQLFRTAL